MIFRWMEKRTRKRISWETAWITRTSSILWTIWVSWLDSNSANRAACSTRVEQIYAMRKQAIHPYLHPHPHPHPHFDFQSCSWSFVQSRWPLEAEEQICSQKLNIVFSLPIFSTGMHFELLMSSLYRLFQPPTVAKSYFKFAPELLISNRYVWETPGLTCARIATKIAQNFEIQYVYDFENNFTLIILCLKILLMIKITPRCSI